MSLEVGNSDSRHRSEQITACEAYLRSVVDKLEGWLDRFTAKRTFDLLLAQERYHVTGALYEVGLFYGKYFSLLVQAGYRTKSKVLGIDTFEYVSQSQFLSVFMDSLGSNLLGRPTFLEEVGTSVVKSSSTDLSADEIKKRLGGSLARFVSIDGSHEYNDVFWDLKVAASLLAPGGIIAVDDYLHPICLGVTAATNRFLDENVDVVPFAYVSNKLFLCRPGWADRFRTEVEEAIIYDSLDPKSRAFKVHVDAGASSRRNIEVSYCGYRVLTVPI